MGPGVMKCDDGVNEEVEECRGLGQGVHPARKRQNRTLTYSVRKCVSLIR